MQQFKTYDSLNWWKEIEAKLLELGPMGRITVIEIILSICYPRLDINVSKETNHLLKSPWCVHKATGQICVPISPEMFDTFDPTLAPKLGEVVKQFQDSNGQNFGVLEPYLKYFNEYSESLMKSRLN
eukprot:GHVP01001385.1.p1 GENE.GHVP01001385.1~~GHVP01001385.1.p1  ORF type:complete len:127 (+),score=25.20 GHVP01001385.1:290-670(+)